MSGKFFAELLVASGLARKIEDTMASDVTPPVLDANIQSAIPEPLPEVVVQLESTEIVEGRPFDEIFASANLPPSPFPAERLLRLLDGLREMDETTRRTAVAAMDSADDTWTIGDPVRDAQLKVAALESYRETLHAQVAAAEQRVSAQVADATSAQERVVGEIRKQISELEQLLQREIQRSAEQVATLQSGLKATREATEREGRRLAAEIDKLRTIPAQFSHPAAQQ